QHVSVRGSVSVCVPFLAWLETSIESHSVLSPAPRCHRSHIRSLLTHVFAGAPPGDESLFVRYFHWVGCGHCCPYSRTYFPGWHRRGMRGRGGIRDTGNCASSRRQRRYTGDAAGGTGYKYLARHTCRTPYPPLLSHVSRWDAWNHLRHSRCFHAVIDETNG